MKICIALFYSSYSLGRTVRAESENISVKTAASVREEVETQVLLNKSNRFLMYENGRSILWCNVQGKLWFSNADDTTPHGGEMCSAASLVRSKLEVLRSALHWGSRTALSCLGHVKAVPCPPSKMNQCELQMLFSSKSQTLKYWPRKYITELYQINIWKKI